MSACSSTVRAVSRSRVPPLKTLLPFLYQTTTIQQWQPATRPIARRNITSRSRSNDGDDIPFEADNLPPPIDQAPRKTTITGTERAAFQKLYKKFNTEGRQQKEKDHIVELDQIADEYYEDDEDNSKPSLDEIFDEAMRGDARLRASRTPLLRPKTGAQPGKDALDSSEIEPGKARSSRGKAAGVDTAPFKEMRSAERERIDKLIRDAPTDRALWEVLEREVFAKVRQLNLDNIGTTKGGEAATESTSTSKNSNTESRPTNKPEMPPLEQRILFKNYAHHLVTAVAVLRSEFPASPLPLSILPTVKSLGRSSHALGATTILYKNLLRTAWIQQSSYATIDTLLTDMDNNAIEFDPDILVILDHIIKENNQARGGVLGREIQMVYNMDMSIDGVGKLVAWRRIVAERLGFKNDGMRTTSDVVRRVPQQKRKTSTSAPADRDNAEVQGKRDAPDAQDNGPLAGSTDVSSTDVSSADVSSTDVSSTDVSSADVSSTDAEADTAAEPSNQENNTPPVEESKDHPPSIDDNHDAPTSPEKIIS
ncbi:hypothetical protein ACJQWK_06241 [Exserohilum turcicum]|uniref:Mtf2-like C-terminal domain-containing protein n=1 Tax=Exserohilum turcicum (strain 28A) TaxID=671987 RepID=R0JV44_EXST2|nr:uncharacterized protein SETTUDRAFT_42095 [Exserohilum turcica Et28A]EOA84898.1 hypothetical protein SETTUDRAFT_42095 [Exserohilum turcica Et28A]